MTRTILTALAIIAASPALAGTSCGAGAHLIGADAVAAIRAECQAGDTITFREGMPTCEGSRCTSTTVEDLCDLSRPIGHANYGYAYCFYKGLPKPPAKPVAPKRPASKT